MAKTKRYEIKLLASNESGAKRTYYRGGVQFTVLEPQVLELTNEEVKVFKDDARLTVKGVSDKSESDESETVSDSESDVSTEDEVTEEDSSTEDTDSEDTSSDEAEEVSDDAPEAPSVDSLLKLSRNELNAKASELNIENADKLETKTEVAEAIVNATS